MKNEYLLLMLSLVFVLSLVPRTGHAQKKVADLRNDKISIQDRERQVSENHTAEKKSGALSGQNNFNVRVWNESLSSDASAADTFPVTYSSQVTLLNRAAGFTQHVIFFNPLAAEGKYSYLKDILTFISLNTSLSSHSRINDDFRNGTKLYELLNVSYAFEMIHSNGLTQAFSADFTTSTTRSEESAHITVYNDSALKPFIHNPFHDSAISVYLPINLSRSLTIAPAITYAFSTNNTNNQEYKGKGLVNNIIDKHSAIVYGGLHLKYSF